MRTEPRRLVLLGGITWHSTLVYERLLHQGVAAQIPGRTADLVIRHYDFGTVGQAQNTGEWVRIANRVNYADDTSALFVNGVKVLSDDELERAVDVLAEGDFERLRKQGWEFACLRLERMQRETSLRQTQSRTSCG